MHMMKVLKIYKQKIREKLLLFQHSEYLIFCADDERLLHEIELFQQKNNQLQLFSWGKKSNNTFADKAN